MSCDKATKGPGLILELFVVPKQRVEGCNLTYPIMADVLPNIQDDLTLLPVEVFFIWHHLCPTWQHTFNHYNTDSALSVKKLSINHVMNYRRLAWHHEWSLNEWLPNTPFSERCRCDSLLYFSTHTLTYIFIWVYHMNVFSLFCFK